MYLAYWRLREHPFRPNGRPESLPLAGSQLESLARLRFLVEGGWRVGSLTGLPGTGKSLLLARLGQEFSGRGQQVLRWSLVGSEPGELALRLSGNWEGSASAALRPSAAWQRIEDRLRVAHFLRQGVVVLLDDADDLAGAQAAELRRLLVTAERAGARISLILASGQGIHDRAICPPGTLRIELGPWDAAETAGQIPALLERAGRVEPIFEADALAQLHELTGGVPGHVLSLAELSLATAAAQEIPKIDAGLVELIYESLDTSATSAASLA